MVLDILLDSVYSCIILKVGGQKLIVYTFSKLPIEATHRIMVQQDLDVLSVECPCAFCSLG